VTEDLYHHAIMARAREGARDSRIVNADAAATADNPLCGDRSTVEVALRHGRIAAIGHRTRGCALCQASAAVLAAHAVGETPNSLGEIATSLARMIAEGGAPPSGPWAELAMFAPVHRHRSRHDCVLLPFQAARAALERRAGVD
jgi:NifU-like protein involved in Fe-S cluster formation